MKKTSFLFVCFSLLFAAKTFAVELKGHTESVHTAVFSVDGKRIVTASEDETVRIWDAESGKELKELKGTFIAASQDGKRVVVSNWVNDRINLQIWNADSDKIQTISPKGDPPDVMFFGFIPSEAKSVSPDGKKIITVVADGNGNNTAQVWDTDTGKELRRLGDRPSGLLNRRSRQVAIHTALFSPDGKKIMTQSTDATIRVLDAASGRELFNVKGFTGDFSPDGSKFVTVNTEEDENAVHIWDANNGKKIADIEGAANLKFSPDGKRIVTESLGDAPVRIWDTTSGKMLSKLKEFPPAFSPDSKNVVVSDSRTQILDANTGKEIQKWTGSFLSFSPDGKKIALATKNSVQIQTVAGSAL